MLRLGVRMRVRAASTAVRTAVDTRVKDPSAWPSRLAATDSASLRVMQNSRGDTRGRAAHCHMRGSIN